MTLETAVPGSRQSSFFASSGFLPCMHPWQKLSEDDHRTNKNSSGQLIDRVRLVSGVVSWIEPLRRMLCMGWLAWAGRRQGRRMICERLVLRGGTQIMVSYWALSNVLLMFCVCVLLDHTGGNVEWKLPHIRHGGLSRVSLC